MTSKAGGGAKQYIHYDPERVDYAVTAEELARLEAAGTNLWKDVCLVTGALGVSCLINAIAHSASPFKLTLSLFLNYLCGAIGIALSFIFGIAWYRGRRSFREVIGVIKQKPKMEIALPEAVNVGSLPTASLSETGQQHANDDPIGGSDQVEAG